MRESLRAQTDQLFAPEPFQERVLTELRMRRQTNTSRSVWKRLWAEGARRRTLWVSAVSGVAAAMAVVVVFAQSYMHGAVKGAYQTRTLAQELAAAQPSESALQTLNVTLAPISSQNVTVTAQTAMSANAATHASASHGVTKEAGSAAGTRSGTAAGGAHGFIALTPNVLTFHARLYNTSASPVSGRQLQGMLFVLHRAGGLSPMQASDWEYFVNGPNVVIPPHSSAAWSFTLNPTPSFTHLNNRYIHLVWMLRKQSARLPSLSMGLMPIHVSQVHVRVTGTGGVGDQFLTITARVRNGGRQPWIPHTALGMLFFERYPGAELLSRGTYKYFDDVVVLSGPSQKLEPGQSATVEFQITGVPNTNMLNLPLRILLVARSQVGA